MPTLFAYAALLLFPLVAIVLFRRLGTMQGVIWTILLGYLFLPSRPAFDIPIPGIPVIDKTFVPAFCALILAWRTEREKAALQRRLERRQQPEPAARDAAARAAAPVGSAVPASASPGPVTARPTPAGGTVTSPARRGRQSGVKNGGRSRGQSGARSGEGRKMRGHWMLIALIAMFLFVPILSSMGNQEAIIMDGRTLRGFQLYDAGSLVVASLVALLPFLLARRYLATPEAHRALLWAFAVTGLIYMVLSLWEIRMSPQLNKAIYGFFPHEWKQHIRRGGYRPVGFLHHGLWLGIFLAMATVAVAALCRIPEEKRRLGFWSVATLMLIVVLWMAKSLGAFMLMAIFVPVVLLCGTRMRLLIVAVLAGTVLLYPMLRGAGLIPVEKIVQISNDIDQARGDSLAFRLVNEDAFLKRAAEKPLTGWGGMGRWMVFDPATGNKLAIPDGYWVLIIGQYGWLGYLATFGLLTVPVMLLALRSRRLGIDLATSGLALVLVVNVIDLIPNGTLTPITWILAGSLAGRYELGRVTAPEERRLGFRRRSLGASGPPDPGRMRPA